MAKSRRLFLVRHAKSSWDDISLDDRERPLNERGKEEAPRMGKHLAGYDIKPDMITSSPAVRALKTAEKIAKELGFKKSDVVADEGIYTFGGGSLMDVVRGFDDKYRSVMMVGHNPAITSFANELSNAGIDNIPTCGVVLLEFDAAKWKDVGKGGGRLLEFDYPKKLWGKA
ncbi:MAG: histidine phosphatase family protein [Thermodesulfobacteriota bacterium]